jgi:hypothetical protein
MDEIASERADECVRPCFQADAVVDARIVDQAVDRAVFAKRLLYRALACVVVAELDLDPLGLGLCGGERALEIRSERGARENDRNRAFAREP